MEIEEILFGDIVVIKKTPSFDERGSFERVFCLEKLGGLGVHFDCVQQSISRNTRRGTIRGLHYQEAPYGEDKIIQCIKGEVYDVLVDLAPDSPGFGRWTGITLSEANGRMIIVPQKYAHGFQTLVDDAIMMYHMNNYYTPSASRGVNCFSDALSIDWPVENYIISDKDRGLPQFERTKVR